MIIYIIDDIRVADTCINNENLASLYVHYSFFFCKFSFFLSFRNFKVYEGI